MFAIVIPILSVILVGLVYGKLQRPSPEAEAHINRYVLYVALPCMIFLAVAKATPEELRHGAFLGASLAGIMACYGLGLLLARRAGITAPHSSLVGMASSFGNTGYMGTPLVLAAFGDAGAAPAAISIILHNIPAFFAVIMTFGACSATGSRERGDIRGAGAVGLDDGYDRQDAGQSAPGDRLKALLLSLLRAVRAVLANPLTLAAMAGGIFVGFSLPVPLFLETFTRFMGSAAAPTGLFVLGLSLARMDVRRHISKERLRLVLPIVAVKNLAQPLLTLLAALAFDMRFDDHWLAIAVIMAATPTGALTYLFAFTYKSDLATPSLAIILSSLLSILTLPLAIWTLH